EKIELHRRSFGYGVNNQNTGVGSQESAVRYQGLLAGKFVDLRLGLGVFRILHEFGVEVVEGFLVTSLFFQYQAEQETSPEQALVRGNGTMQNGFCLFQFIKLIVASREMEIGFRVRGIKDGRSPEHVGGFLEVA